MLISVLRAKIHRATVTDANLNYEGSLTIDQDLMETVGILPYELVQVVNINNGARAETYAIRGERGSGDIIMNGAIARLAQPGDLVIICAYGFATPDEAKNTEPAIALVNAKNQVVKLSKPKQ